MSFMKLKQDILGKLKYIQDIFTFFALLLVRMSMNKIHTPEN